MIMHFLTTVGASSYLPNTSWRLNWHASPILAPDEHFKRLPPTHITVAEIGVLPLCDAMASHSITLDVLRDQGLNYAKKCAAHGAQVSTKGKSHCLCTFCYPTKPSLVYERLPHSAVGLDANVDAARQWIQDLCDVLKAQLWD